MNKSVTHAHVASAATAINVLTQASTPATSSRSISGNETRATILDRHKNTVPRQQTTRYGPGVERHCRSSVVDRKEGNCAIPCIMSTTCSPSACLHLYNPHLDVSPQFEQLLRVSDFIYVRKQRLLQLCTNIMPKASFMQIPDECLLIILARIDLQSLCHVSGTCQYMRRLIKVRSFYSTHAYRSTHITMRHDAVS